MLVLAFPLLVHALEVGGACRVACRFEALGVFGFLSALVRHRIGCFEQQRKTHITLEAPAGLPTCQGNGGKTRQPWELLAKL